MTTASPLPSFSSTSPSTLSSPLPFYNTSISRNNKRSHSNHRGQAVAGHWLNSNAASKTAEKAKMEKEKIHEPVQCVGKDTVPSGSVVNTTESSSGGSRITPSTARVKETSNDSGSSAQRPTRKRRKNGGKASLHNGSSMRNGSSSESQFSGQPPKQKQDDSKHEKQLRTTETGQRVPGVPCLSSCVVDSGRGDELSSSCESDPPAQVDEGRNLPVKLSGPQSPQSPVPVSSSHSDVEEEFQDALSHLPSENEQSKSSTSSSAFVTPLPTRSQSPVLSKASSEVSVHLGHELAKALVDSLNDTAERQENTDSSGIASDVSKDTVVDASSVQDSSSYEEKGSLRDSDEKEPSGTASTAASGTAASGTAASGTAASGTAASKASLKSTSGGSHSKSGPKKRLNGVQRSKARRADQAKFDSAAQSGEPGRGKESNYQKRDVGRYDSRTTPHNDGLTSSLDSLVSRKHPGRYRSKKMATVDQHDRASHHQTKKPQPLLLHSVPPEQKPPAAAIHLPSKGQKGSQLGVEFSSLSSASPASSVCSYSPVTLSPSPTASLQMHQPIVAESSQPVVVESTTNLTATSGSQEPVSYSNNDDDMKDEWPDFGMFMSSSNTGNSNNVGNTNVLSPVVSQKKSVNELSDLTKWPEPPSCSATTSAPEILSPNPEAPSSAFKVLASVSRTLPITNEFPLSAFKVLSSSTVPFSNSEVPSSAFKVPSSTPEVVLTSAPKQTTSAPEQIATYEQFSVPDLQSSSRVVVEEEEEEQDSGCNMSTCSGGGESTTSGGGGVSTRKPELTTTEHAQYPVVPEGPLNPQCDPQQQHLSPNQYLQLKREQLNMFVQQYQEKLEKQTDNQIFFPVDPPPPPPHVTMMMSSPPVPMLSPPPIQMMTPTMFLQSPPPPLHHLHPVGPDIRTTLAAGAPPCLSSSPPPAPPPPLPPNLPYNVVLPPLPPPPLAVVTPACGLELSMTVSGHCINACAAEFHPSEEEPVEEVGVSVEEVGVSVDEVKHPLSDTWVMWFDRIVGAQRSRSSNYHASLNEVSAISSIEQFWQVYNNIVSPQDMDQNSNLHYFKQGIQPLWEDPANQDGGKWVLTIKNDPERLAKCWMEVLLLLVGGGVEKGHLINGAVASRRKKGDRIALWTCTRDEEANLDICIDLMRAVMLAYSVPLEEMEVFMKDLSEGRHGMSLVFMYHSDALASGRSYQNNAHIKMADHIEVILHELRRVHSSNPSEKVD